MATKTIKVPRELHRQAVIERGEDGKPARMSVSSDTPYKRHDYWNDEWYFEVLDHGPGGLDDERLKAGLPILFNHRRDAHLARAQEYKNDGHKISLDVSKFLWASGQFAEEKRADMESGALPDSSVGYELIDDGVCVGAKDELPIYKFKWRLYEASAVTVPADISVGMGRERDQKPDAEPKEILIDLKNNVADCDNVSHKQPAAANRSQTTMDPTPPAAPEIDVAKERGSAVSEFKARCKKIDDYVDGLKNPNWKAAATVVANKHKDGEANFDEFRTEALNSFEGVKQAVETASIGMEEKDVKRFSLLSAIRAMATKGRLEGYEKEVCEAAQKQMRRNPADSRAFILPDEVSRYYDTLSLQRMLLERAQNVTTATAGGYTVQNQYGPLIELLRNRTVLGQLGITIMDGLVGDFVMPVQTGGATAYWVSETGAITDSEATFGQKALTPHRLGCAIPFTMQFIAQSSLSVEAFIRNEMDITMALKKDLAGLAGTGVGGEPLGVKNTTGINATVTFGGAATWLDLVEFETGINVDNADIGTMGFAVSAATVGKWKGILKDSVAGAGYLLSEGMTANGYPVYRTNQITDGIVYFGVWSQLIMGIWAGREVTVDNITLAKTGQHQIIINEFVDFLVRQPAAFNVSTDTGAA